MHIKINKYIQNKALQVDQVLKCKNRDKCNSKKHSTFINNLCITMNTTFQMSFSYYIHKKCNIHHACFALEKKTT